jgi:CheY-like chemotaxis protein
MSEMPHNHAVLVVDDDPGALDGLVYYLQSHGFDVVGALGGERALQRLRDGLRPCAVVTDVVMPWVDGWALVEAMRVEAGLAEVPVVMCSGHPEHVSRALQHGVRAYLPKPVEPGAVAAAIVRYCRWVPGTIDGV